MLFSCKTKWPMWNKFLGMRTIEGRFLLNILGNQMITMNFKAFNLKINWTKQNLLLK